MGRVRRYQSLVVALLSIGLAGAAVAEEDTTGLYDRPVLVLDPGMHTAPIWRAGVDASGTYAVTGSEDKTVRVWSVENGKLLRTVRVPTGPGNVGKIYAVAISPDGEIVAAGGWTDPGPRNPIYLFHRETGALVRRIEGLPNVVFHLAFSPDGRFLVAMPGGASGLRIYDRQDDWAEITRDEDYGDSSFGAAFAPDGRLATTSFDGHVRLYDHAIHLVAKRKTEGGSRPFGVAFNPSGDRLAVGHEDSATVSIVDGHNLSPLPGPDTGGVDNGGLSVVAWSADGSTLFAGGMYHNGSGVPVVAWAEKGSRRELPAGQNVIMSLLPLRDGGLLVGGGDPYLALLGKDGTPRWERRSQQADLRGQRHTLSVSDEGNMVDFGYEEWGEAPVRFDLSDLKLTFDPSEEGQTETPGQDGLKIESWVDSRRPTLRGKPLPLDKYEISRSLSIHPDGKRFLLGTEWWLRAFDDQGEKLWQRPVPGVVWAVNISGDGRLVIAAYDDGTIRWHRMDDGRELLAFFPFSDKRNWVAWTPEGVYAATPGARGVLRWHVNRGGDQAGDSIPVHEIPETNRPEVIKLVLQEMGTPGAIAVAELAKIRTAVLRRTRAVTAPGARLHVLTVGVGEYGDAAKHLRLSFADDDAEDVAAALTAQDSLYAGVSVQRLKDHEANRAGILRGLASVRAAMAKNEGGHDLAVVHFSGHGALVDGEFYLLPYEVDVGDPVAITSTALPASMLRQQIGTLARHGRVLVLLDACRSGGAMANGAAFAVDARLLRSVLVGPNVTVLTSSTSRQLSREDGRWGNGAFTEIFLEALGSKADANRNGMISVTEMAGYLTQHVGAITGGEQVPGVEIRFDGDLFVAVQ